jgi:hypothetical protein
LRVRAECQPSQLGLRRKRPFIASPADSCYGKYNIVTGIVEYIIPTGWLGGDKIANRLGNPAIDFVVGETRQWSNASGGAYVQMTAGIVLKTGWRF